LVHRLANLTDVTTFTVHEAKTNLSRLIARAAAGEEIVIARGHEPVVRLVPLRPPPGPRAPGSDSGLIWMADDFDVLPDEVLETFEAPMDRPGAAAARPRKKGRRRT
jgi:prevent-host-death family protein